MDWPIGGDGILERMKQHPKKATALLVVMLVVALLTGTLWPSGSSVVHAESINLTYDMEIWGGYDYSKYPSLTPTNTVAKAGYKIKSLKVVNYMNNQVVKTISDAEGKTSYTFSGVLFSGIGTKVSSKENRTTQGYYAWYRYVKGTNGNNWNANFARVDDSYNEYGDSRTSKAGDNELDSYGMPAHPGTTDNNLSLTGLREKEFYTDGGQWVDPRYISHDELTGSATVNSNDSIRGPEDEGITGYAKPATISLNKVDAFPDLDRIIVRYGQDFNYVEDNFKPLAAYGAALMVYFSAFTVDLESYTYHYPYKLEVEYMQLGSSPLPSVTASSTPKPTPTPTPTPDVEKIVAQFEIEEPVIEYGEYNWAKPIGSSVTGGGQKLKEYVWTISQNGNTETETSNAVLTMGGFPSFPRWLTTGTVSVSLKVVSTSGNSASAGPKTFQIITPASCTSYNPNLDFQIGFVDHGNRSAWQPMTTAIVGDYLDVQELARRPDDDPIPSGSYPKTVISWDWKNAAKSSAWLKKYYENYQPNDNEEYYSFPYTMVLTNADLGNHSITATKSDACGNSRSSTASVAVVPPNPIALIRGPTTVKEARPLTEAFDSSGSYSPVRGRSINHNRDEWGNKQTVYYTPGTETITLRVWDNGGLPSLEEARHTLTVLPDEPPVALLKTQSKAIRGTNILLKDASYSPDGDTIKFTELFVKYDSNNNGSFDDEAETQLFFDASGNLNRQYDRVGKYRYRIRAVEDSPLSKEATTTFDVDVVNDSPWVSFEMASEVKEPQIIPTVRVSLNPGDWAATSVLDETVKKNWRVNDDGSMGTYWYYAFSKSSSSFYPGNPRVLSTRTSNPAASQYVANTGRYATSNEDGDSTQSYNYYLDGIGIFSDFRSYCRDCGSQSYSDARFKTFDGTRFFDSYNSLITDVNILADEVRIMESWPTRYTVYKLSSMFTPTPVILRVNSPITPGPEFNAGGSAFFNFIPPKVSNYVPLNEGWYDIITTGPASDYSYAEFSALEIQKKNKAGGIVWKTSTRSFRPNGDGDHYYPRVLLYNMDESIIYSVGRQSWVDKDDSDNSSVLYHRAVTYDAATGSPKASVILPAAPTAYQSNAVFVYNNKLHILSDDGLRVYDENLTLLKYDNRVAKTGILTGDGFLRFELGAPALYDLRSYAFMPMNPTSFIRPVEYFHSFNNSIYGYLAESNNSYYADVLWAKMVPYDRPLTTHSQLTNAALPAMSDFNIAFEYKYQETDYLDMNVSGMSFKMQDNKNMYRLEFNASRVSLVKIVQGTRTVLHTQPYTFEKGMYYSFRIRSNANKHTVYVNSVPLFDVTDSTFHSGSFGPSTDFFNVSFKDMTYQDLSNASGSSLTKDTVLVDQPIQYALTFEDTENDPHPIDLTWWQFEQTSPWKFLDAGDGKTGWSPMNGATQHGSLPSLDRVGIWRVTHWLKDDPHPWFPYPSEVFGSYRAESNRYSRNIIVHRRPVALFTLWLNGDGTVGWNEQSYDPDRWMSAWNYSTESPVYATNRGIYARKYKFITPSGMEQEGKLTRPTESGVYTISEAVMDEYGAWSDWYDQQITATIVLPPNKAPVVDFESPRYVYRDDLNQLINKSVDPDGDPMTFNWSIMKPPYTSWLSNAEHPQFRISDRGLGKDAVSPNWFITLEATDSKGETGSKTKPLTVLNHIPTTAIYGQQEVLIRQTHNYQSGGNDADSEDRWNLSYYWRVTTPDGTETEATGSTISLTFSQGGTYKLEHWVIDPVGDSSNIAQLLVSVDDNKPPVPGFTVTPNPAYRGDPVEIVSTASDPDGIIIKHDYWINGPEIDQHWTSSPDWNRTYSTLGSYTIRQRVEDNKGAAAETSQVVQVINRLPTVELTTPSGPDMDHPSVNIPPFRAEWSYADLDGDQQQSWHFRIYEAGSDRLMIQGSGSNTAGGFDVTPGVLVGGTTYYGVVTVSDGYDSVTSAPKYFILNRPPVADFDWSPKPVWEGDAVRLTSLSYDPDGDALTYLWHIVNPSGQVSTGSLPEWTGVWTEQGGYRVTLTVSDGLAEASAQKTVEVQPLTIEADILHTPEWLQYHVERGHETSYAPKDFYAGEKLILHIASAPAPVRSAEAYLEATGIGGDNIRVEALLSAGSTPVLFDGELYDPVMGSLDNRLPDGLHEVHFRLVYSNGVVKETTVPFRIIGSALGTVGVHRVQ